MVTNKEWEIADKFVNQTNRNVFLTGKAGTGKTTFLHALVEESKKRIIVVAPTGVAAINAKGVTIHSFFQLPFGPIPPDGSAFNQKSYRFSKVKLNIIRSLDLLIIDEISMVRADVLDGIDWILRKFRNPTKPFGGVQVLMIGDLQQLAPVIKPGEWAILQRFYTTGYFFGSRVFRESDVLTIELKHIYRQENQEFISVLNAIRNNTMDQATLEHLNSRYIPDFDKQHADGYITLTTHNYRADSINAERLMKLTQKNFRYKATIQGDFPEHMYPTHLELEFKVGAQVMFIKNDSNPEKRYFNGKIGKIVELSSDKIYVQCPGDGEPIEATPLSWENIRYGIDGATKEITENIIGNFTQMPLRLAWAVTIHKSQGLTFDRIIVDAEDAFAHGQTYVALSRCTTLEGIVLSQPLTGNSVICDETVRQFTTNATEQVPDERSFHKARNDYQRYLIFELFDCYGYLKPLERLERIIQGTSSTILKGNLKEKVGHIKNIGIIPLLKINTKFQEQLQELNIESTIQASDSFQSRFKRGVTYFITQLDNEFKKNFDDIQFDTDNTEIQSNIDKQLIELERLYSVQKACLTAQETGFSVEVYLDVRAKASIEEGGRVKSKKRDVVHTGEHSDLYQELRALRLQLSEIDGVPPYMIFTQQSLHELCEFLPANKSQLGKISGIGKVRLEKYGEQILETIDLYCAQNNITARSAPTVVVPVKTIKIDTKKVSYDLFREGKTVDEIARERKLQPETIKNHLVHYILLGEMDVFELMEEAKYNELRRLITTLKYDGFKALKEQIDPSFSYADIKLVHTMLDREKQ